MAWQYDGLPVPPEAVLNFDIRSTAAATRVAVVVMPALSEVVIVGKAVMAIEDVLDGGKAVEKPSS